MDNATLGGTDARVSLTGDATRQSPPSVPAVADGGSDAADGAAIPVVATVTESEATALHLSLPQRAAIAVLTAGRTRCEAAAAAGVHRGTVHRWLQNDPQFQAAFNAWQNDVRTTAQAQLLAATHEAIATVLTAIRRGDSRLAWKLLQAQNMTVPAAAGPTDPLEVARKQAVADRRKQNADQNEMNALAIETIGAVDEFGLGQAILTESSRLLPRPQGHGNLPGE